MNYHKFFIDRVYPNDIVLDVGCGNGALAYDISKKAKRVIGIDIQEKYIASAKKKYSAENLEFIVGDITNPQAVALTNLKPNVIILSNVLEHIEYRKGFLMKIRSLAPKFLIRVPMLNRDWITLYKKELGVEWRLDSTHYTEYTLEQLREELESVGMRIEEYTIQFGELWATVITGQAVDNAEAY
jgi:2-polyprenyl-3-methyl-5-hydroxy-6-metoxy-1,4-benzoquinol methylase